MIFTYYPSTIHSPTPYPPTFISYIYVSDGKVSQRISNDVLVIRFALERPSFSPIYVVLSPTMFSPDPASSSIFTFYLSLQLLLQSKKNFDSDHHVYVHHTSTAPHVAHHRLLLRLRSQPRPCSSSQRAYLDCNLSQPFPHSRACQRGREQRRQVDQAGRD